MNRFIQKGFALLLALTLSLSAFAFPAAAAENEETAGTLLKYFEKKEQEWLQRPSLHNGVPLYYQTDYPHTPYGKGTVASSGCGITCLAMVATYLTGEEHLPDGLAEEFGSLQMNNVQRINHAIEAMGLPLESMPTKWWQVSEALQRGQVVILLVNDRTPFSGAQHFLVLTGITKDRNVMVCDPYRPNYNRPELARGFIYGFPESILDEGFDGGWIFEKNESYQEPQIPDLSLFHSESSEEPA